MAEHTCTVTAGHMLQQQCPGCQDQFTKICEKEAEILDLVQALSRLEYVGDWAELYELGAELNQLRAASLGGNRPRRPERER